MEQKKEEKFPEILSQDEIDALLDSIDNSIDLPLEKTKKVTIVDLKRQYHKFLDAKSFINLKKIAQSMIHPLEKIFSEASEKPFNIFMQDVMHLTFEEFMRSLYRKDCLAEICLDTEERFLLHLPEPNGKDFYIENLAANLMSTFRNEVASKFDFRYKIEKIYNDSYLVKTYEDKKIMILIFFGYSVEGVEGNFGLLTPVDFWKKVFYVDGGDRELSMNDLKVGLEVVVGDTEISIGELKKLDEGSLVMLKQTFGDPFTVKVQGIPKFRGEIVSDGDNIGIRVTDII